MRFLRKWILPVIVWITICPANAQGWPSSYQGVMLQGFYWDSYTETSWRTLTAAADEYSRYFSLIWVPNSAKAEGMPSMGYHPVYWFTNHNSSFGTEAELRTMISTYKAKGVGIIADVVVNHRSGVSNWTDFPAETWRGKSYQLGPQHICRNDEVRDAAGQATPTGADDTGENWAASRDLDHTSPVVQENVNAYISCLLTDFGYAGCRYDFVKGYAPQFTKLYNQTNNVKFSVGEYWEGSYDKCAAWIEGTSRTSAAFDFPFKYAVNEAFASNDYSKLCWMANGNTPQPAGLIHYGYPQWAVTLIDNHDTYRDGSKFTGDVLAANAFMLCSPGTPCVFLPHYQQHKVMIQNMIEIRNNAGLTNTSTVQVLRHDRNCYMAVTTGTKGKVAVSIGSTSETPAGFQTSDLKLKGDKFAIWSTATGGGGNTTKGGTIYWENSTTSWTTPHCYYYSTGADGASNTWPGTAMTKVDGDVWSITVPDGHDKVMFTDGAATGTQQYPAANQPGFDFKAEYIYSPTGSKPYTGNDDPVEMPAKFYLIGNLSTGSWDTSFPMAMIKNGNCYETGEVTITDAGGGSGYFSFITTTGANWDVVNGSDRYGAVSKDCPIQIEQILPVVKYPANISASSAPSWKVAAGKYKVIVDFSTMTVKLTNPGGVETVTFDPSSPAEYFTPQGVRVVHPQLGNLYIVRQGTRTYKVVLP